MTTTSERIAELIGSAKDPVDKLGLLQHEIAALQVTEERLKDKIKAKGDGSHVGDFYSATVSSYDRETLPIDTAKSKLRSVLGLKAANAWIKRHTKKTPVESITVSARTGHNLKAAA